MSNNVKYISFLQDNFDKIVIFGDIHFTHAEMADRLNIGKEKIIGAGFVNFSYPICETYGESVSLNTKSHKDDTILLRKLFFGDHWDCVKFEDSPSRIASLNKSPKL